MPDPIQIKLVPTPNPAELGFIVYVADQAINPDVLPAVGTLYSAWTLPGRPRVWESLGAYVYVQPVDGPDGYLGFAFFKAKSAEERAIPFRSFTDWKDAQWHNVLLEAPLFVKDTNFLIASPFENNGTALVPRWYARRKWLPGGTYRCKHVVEQFLSPTPWTAEELEGSPEPVPTEIAIELPGLEFTLPKCLHPEVKAPELNTGLVVATEDGLSQPREGLRIEGQIFPATNVRRWQPRILNEQMQLHSGQWFRERVTIDPPETVRIQRY